MFIKALSNVPNVSAHIINGIFFHSSELDFSIEQSGQTFI